jgi:aspartate aminotransferase
LTEGRVARCPAQPTCLSPYFRISTANGEDVLTEAIERVSTAIAQLE